MATRFENYITGDDKDVEGLWSADAWLSQSFTPSISHTITSVKLLLLKTGNPGTITVGIYATSGDDPTGSALCSGTTDGDTLPTGSPYEWREITLGDGALLTAGTKYAILAKALSANVTNFVAWRADSTSPTYSGGTQRHTVDGGGGWSSWGYDLMFEEWSTGVGAVSVAAPSVTTQAVTSIGKTTATGNGNVTNLGLPPATQHGVCWATFENPVETDDNASCSETEDGVPSATGAYTSSMTGLKANTKYYVRAYITNTVGTIYGTEVSFTTLPDVPAVTTYLAKYVAVASALLTGTVDNTGGSSIIQLGILLRAGVDPDIDTYDSITQEDITLLSMYSLELGLTPETEYHFRAYAINSDNPDTPGYGDVLKFTTNVAGVPIVKTRATINITPTTATGRGEIVDLGGSSVTQHGHCWKAITDPPTVPTTSDSKTALGAGTVDVVFLSELSSLTAGTSYVICAYATNTQGTAYGDPVNINEYAHELQGQIAYQGKHLLYTDATGKQRRLLGAPF